MDRNSIIGLLLIGTILVGYSLWTAPTQEELEARKREQDSIAALEQQTPVPDPVAATPAQPVPSDSTTLALNDTLLNADSLEQARTRQLYGAFASGATGTEKIHTLENENLRISFSNHGGRVTSVKFLNYKSYLHNPVRLFEGDSTRFGLNFFAQNREVSTDKLFFNENAVTDSSITYRLYADDPGKYIEFRWTLPSKGYMLDYSVSLIELSDLVSQNTNFIDLTWNQAIYQNEKSLENEKNVSTIYYKYPDEDADHLSETDSDNETLSTRTKWISFKQQYFNTTLISDEAFDKPTRIRVFHNESETDSLLKVMNANFTLAYRHQPANNYDMHFYFGPNHFQTLKRLDLGMEKIIPLGWGIFGWVNKFIVIPIFNFLNRFDISYGIIILILTIAIKLMLLPFTYKAYMSTAKMKVLRPEMEEIQKKYKDDQMKSQQELMGLYRKAGVNPLGGCLPILLQMPVLIAMFRFFPASIELRQEGFLWADDLSTYDSILDLPFSIPFYGDHVSLFTILMTISALLYTMMNSQMTATNPQMKWMMYLMPVMFLGIFNNYSSGLSYYYLLANLISFGQQFLFRSFVNEDAIHAKIQENKKRPQKAKKSKFKQRLEKMAKERGYQPPKR
jgi:YidC/Oxa1 family membrane protein insertase